jgi:hypothetical protein
MLPEGGEHPPVRLLSRDPPGHLRPPGQAADSGSSDEGSYRGWSAGPFVILLAGALWVGVVLVIIGWPFLTALAHLGQGGH